MVGKVFRAFKYVGAWLLRGMYAFLLFLQLVYSQTTYTCFRQGTDGGV